VKRLLLAAAFLLLVLARLGAEGTGGAEGPAGPQTPPSQGPLNLFPQGPRLTPEQLSSLTDRLAVRMSALRGLPLFEPVKKEVHTPAEVRQLLLTELDKDWPPEEMAHWVEAYQALGLLPNGVDLRGVLAAVVTEQLVGAYDPDTKGMFLIDGVPATLVEPVLVHELVHAAQDAHFNLKSLPLEQHENDDLALAVQSLVEGDATAVMFDFMAGRDTSTITDVEGLLRSGPEFLGSPQLALAPRTIRELFTFPYVAGFRLVNALRREGGWERVNAAYEDFPLSTEQVLHPEKFLAGEDRPQEVVLPDALDRVVTDSLIQDNVLGEFGLQLLLEEYTTSEEAVRAAEGWGGDRFRVWRREPKQESAGLSSPAEGKSPAGAESPPGPGASRSRGTESPSWLILLVTTWDSATDAQEFFAAYSRLVANKYEKEEEEPTGDATRRRWRSERGLVEVALRGSDVVVLEGFRPDEREALWQAVSGYRTNAFRWQRREPAAVPAGASSPEH
jgi:hypothetical protein